MVPIGIPESAQKSSHGTSREYRCSSLGHGGSGRVRLVSISASIDQPRRVGSHCHSESDRLREPERPARDSNSKKHSPGWLAQLDMLTGRVVSKERCHASCCPSKRPLSRHGKRTRCCYPDVGTHTRRRGHWHSMKPSTCTAPSHCVSSGNEERLRSSRPQ